MPAVEVRQIEQSEVAHEIERVAAMLTRAFWSSPLTELFAPDPARREEISRWLFAGNLRYGLLYGEVWVAASADGAPRGSAIWWGSEYVQPDDERAARAGLASASCVLDPEGLTRLFDVASVSAELHHAAVSGPHWYLAFLGVDPDHQGAGIASQVLAPVLDRLDAEGLPAYLETAQPRNVSYYRRYGFEVAGEMPLPSSDLVFWGMRRDPR
jgi:ribosomal protein S18 acetylase RimI-like enzyme